MYTWDTEYMKNLLSSGIPEVTVTTEGPGGDYDTENVVITHPGEEGVAVCYIFGMRLDNVCVSDPSDEEVEVVFVGPSQRYGMEEATADEHILCAQVIRILAKEGIKPDTRGWKAHF